MSVNKLALVTLALTMDSKGTVDLVQGQLNMNAHVQTIGTEDGLLSLVPVAGQAPLQGVEGLFRLLEPKKRK